MVGCVFSREVWFGLLKRADFLFLIAQQEDCFEDWWLRNRKRTTKDVCKGFGSPPWKFGKNVMAASSITSHARHANWCATSGRKASFGSQQATPLWSMSYSKC
jgi:hypothetical protein